MNPRGHRELSGEHFGYHPKAEPLGRIERELGSLFLRGLTGTPLKIYSCDSDLP